jgi:Flp pilus assembly protein TadD
MARLEREFQRLRALLPPDSLEHYWPWHQGAMSRNPDDWMRTYRAAAFLMDALGDPQRAEPLWQGLVARLPHFPAAHNELARSMAAQGRTTDAVAMVEKSLSLDPYQPEMLSNLATLRERRGDREGAREALLRALELDPGDESLQARLQSLEG